jgi:hypothetical protein
LLTTLSLHLAFLHQVLKQGALSEKQLAMMTRKEIVDRLCTLDDANVPRTGYGSSGGEEPCVPA